MSLARVCSFQVKLYKPLICVLCLLWFLWSYISTTSFFILLICKWCSSSVYFTVSSPKIQFPAITPSCTHPSPLEFALTGAAGSLKKTQILARKCGRVNLYSDYILKQPGPTLLELPCHHSRPFFIDEELASLTTRKTQFHDSSMGRMYREYFVSTDLDLDTILSCLQTYVVNNYVFVSFARHCPWLEEKEEKVQQEATDSTHGCFLTDCTGKAQRLYFGLESWKTNLQGFNDLRK